MISFNTKITELLNIKYPIVQAGMIWVSGWKLASAVSNNGGLGIIGSGSMKQELLKEHIQKCFAATEKPFGVNIPLMRGDVEDLVKVTVDEGVKIVFSSAGNPKKFTSLLKEKNITVIHVVPSVEFGIKAEAAGWRCHQAHVRTWIPGEGDENNERAEAGTNLCAHRIQQQ